MSISKITADSLGQIDVTQIDAPGEKYQVVDLIPSIKGTEYENELIVVDGKLKVKEDTTLPQETKNEVMELLGQTITANMIKNDAQKYIGKTVTYTNYPRYENETTKTEWRIFNVTDAGVIQLISNDYVDLSYKGTAPATNIVINGYSLRASDNRDTLISYLTTQSNWSEYAIKGTTAVGAPTIQEFCSSYKLKYPDNYVVAKKVKEGEIYNGTDTAVVDGYVVKLSTEADTEYYYIKAICASDDLYIKLVKGNIYGAWLGDYSAEDYRYSMELMYDGEVDRNSVTAINYGVRPLVSLTNAVLVEKADGTLVVE